MKIYISIDDSSIGEFVESPTDAFFFESVLRFEMLRVQAEARLRTNHPRILQSLLDWRTVEQLQRA